MFGKTSKNVMLISDKSDIMIQHQAISIMCFWDQSVSETNGNIEVGHELQQISLYENWEQGVEAMLPLCKGQHGHIHQVLCNLWQGWHRREKHLDVLKVT